MSGEDEDPIQKLEKGTLRQSWEEVFPEKKRGKWGQGIMNKLFDFKMLDNTIKNAGNY